MRIAVEWASVTLHRWIFRDVEMSLCARAWWLHHHWFWRGWVTVFDTLFWLYERDHCRSSYDRCWK